MKHLNRLINSQIFKSLSILVSGTAIAQLIIIGFQVILRRLYTPEIFGAFAVYMSVVSIVVSIASLRYEQTIVLPKQNKDGFALMRLSVIVSVIIISIFSTFLFITSNLFLNWIGLSSEYASWLVFLPISILLFSIYQSINYFLIRIKNFKLVGSNKVIRRVFEGLSQSTLGITFSNFGLVLGDIIGNTVIILYSIFKLRKDYSFFENNGFDDIKEMAVKYKSFPIKNSIPSLMNTLSGVLPIILVSKFFSSEITGFFDLARVVLVIPLSLISVSLNQVLLQHFSELRNKGLSIKRDAINIFLFLLVASAIFIIVIKLFGVSLFALVFGDQWGSSGVYAEILVYAFALKFLISPFNSSFIAFERIGIFSLWQTFYFLLIIGLFFIPFNGITSFLQAYMIIEVVAFLVAGILNFSTLYRYETRAIRDN